MVCELLQSHRPEWLQLKALKIFNGILSHRQTGRGTRLTSRIYCHGEKKREGYLHSPQHPCSLSTQFQHHVTCHHPLLINSTVSSVYIFSLTILLLMQNPTPTVKAETCRSINPQTQVLCKKLVFTFTYLIAAQCPRHTTCRFMSASAKCCLATEPYALRTVQCCHMHCVLLSQFNIQTTAATSTPLNTRNTLTPSPSQLWLISTGDQLAICLNCT